MLKNIPEWLSKIADKLGVSVQAIFGLVGKTQQDIRNTLQWSVENALLKVTQLSVADNFSVLSQNPEAEFAYFLLILERMSLWLDTGTVPEDLPQQAEVVQAWMSDWLIGWVAIIFFFIRFVENRLEKWTMVMSIFYGGNRF